MNGSRHRGYRGYGAGGKGGRDTVYAAIDLGTHNCRMLLAVPRGRGLRVVGSFSRIVKLGESLRHDGTLGDDAVARTLEALGICAKRMESHGVARSRSVATAACRQACNTDAFVDRVRDDTGLQLEVITAEEEARLTLQGCVPLLNRDARNILLFDIGGGSTEVAWVRIDETGRAEIADFVSLDLGVVTLAAEYGGDGLDATARGDIVTRVQTALEPFSAANDIVATVARGGVQLIGTSGTVTTLGALSQGMERYNRSQVDGLRLKPAATAKLVDDLIAMDRAARAQMPVIGPERAELVGVGCAVMEAVCGLWPLDGLTVADSGIREGVLRDTK